MRRIAAEAAVEHVDDHRERVERRIGRPRKVDRLRPLVEQLLQTLRHFHRLMPEANRQDFRPRAFGARSPAPATPANAH